MKNILTDTIITVLIILIGILFLATMIAIVTGVFELHAIHHELEILNNTIAYPCDM